MDLLPASATVWVLVAVALGFYFLNGLHDAANSIATIVSTRVLKPRYAVIWATCRPNTRKATKLKNDAQITA